jgi:hypothetical protein
MNLWFIRNHENAHQAAALSLRAQRSNLCLHTEIASSPVAPRNDSPGSSAPFSEECRTLLLTFPRVPSVPAAYAPATQLPVAVGIDHRVTQACTDGL